MLHSMNRLDHIICVVIGNGISQNKEIKIDLLGNGMSL